jgi:hypothetical protein
MEKMRMPRIFRIGILVVERGLAGRGIDGILDPDHRPAKGLAAMCDLDARIAFLGEPGAGWLRGLSGANAEQKGRHKGRRAQRSHEQSCSLGESRCALSAVFMA